MKYLKLIFFLLFFSGCKNENNPKLNLIKKWYFEDKQTQIPYLMNLSSFDTVYKVITKGGLNFKSIGDTAEILYKEIKGDSVFVHHQINSLMCCQNKFIFVDGLKVYTNILTDYENEYLSFYSNKTDDTILKYQAYYYYDFQQHKKTNSIIVDSTSFKTFFVENDRVDKKLSSSNEDEYFDQTEYYYNVEGQIDSMIYSSYRVFENYYETTVFEMLNNELVETTKYIKSENWMNKKMDTTVHYIQLITLFEDNFPVKEYWKKQGDTVTIVDFSFR